MIREQTDERGMSTPLSHVLSIAITTLLIVALVASATGFLDTQSQRTAREELETIGNRLAGEINKVDTLGRDGENVTIGTQHPDSVAGSTWAARLVQGDCSEINNTTSTCLKLSATNYDFESVVPIDNDTTVHLRSIGSGRYEIRSEGGTGATETVSAAVDLSARVGIGQDVDSGPLIGVGSSIGGANASFEWLSDRPETNSSITFDASDSSASLGTITTYEWDFDNDGAFETSVSTPTVDHNFTNAGRHTVTLKVTTTGGATATETRSLNVVGLEYNDDMETAGASDRVTFTVTNRETQQIELTHLSIDADDSIDELFEGRPGAASSEEFSAPHEIEIDRGPDSSVDGHVDWASPGLTLIDDGPIVDIDGDGDDNGTPVTLNQGETARITVQDFDGTNMVGDRVEFGIYYTIGGNAKSNRIEDTVQASP